MRDYEYHFIRYDVENKTYDERLVYMYEYHFIRYDVENKT